MDTNVVIELLADSFSASATLWLEQLLEKKLHFLSVINVIELLGFKNLAGSERKIIQAFVDQSTVLTLSEDVVNYTIYLRKTFTIKLPDAIIAATAVVYDLTLVTRNKRDFKHVVGLNLIDAHEQ